MSEAAREHFSVTTILVVYFVVMLWIGVRSARKIRGIETFFVADRKGGPLLITGSLLATIVGGSSTVGMAGKGFSWGLVGAWWLLVGAVGLLVLSLLFATRIRNYGLFTLPEILEKHYGPSVKVVASLVILWAWLGIIGGQIAASGQILRALIPGNLSLLMTVSAGVFIAYTILGGQISIIRTDSVQSVIMIVGLFLCAILGLQRIGGIALLRAELPQEMFRFPVNTYFTWSNLLEWLVLVGSAYLVGPDIYSRLFSARDGKTARKSLLIAALVLIPLAFCVTLIGLSARALAPELPGEEALPYMIREVLPQGLNALVMASVLSALMSSADTVLLTASTIFTMDVVNHVVKRRGGKGLEERTALLLSRVAVIIFGLIALGFALRFRGIIRLLLFGYSIYTAGLVVPVIFGFCADGLRLNQRGALAAVIGGGGWVVCGYIGLLSRLGGERIAGLSPGVQGVIVSLILLFVVSYIFGSKDKTITS
jgi:SSS family solute:Na+ symporter